MQPLPGGLHLKQVPIFSRTKQGVQGEMCRERFQQLLDKEHTGCDKLSVPLNGKELCIAREIADELGLITPRNQWSW